MNRTHLEGAAEKLTAQRGYTFYTGPEGDMGPPVRNYPAAWLAPPELHAVEGRTHGRATYDMTLHLLRPGARISPAERRTALAEMETQMLEIFAELSLYERILAVEVLSSPDVWLAEDDGYTAVDVVTEKSVLHRHGAVTCLEIEIRPKRKTGMPWN